jgi:hypothetical protein
MYIMNSNNTNNYYVRRFVKLQEKLKQIKKMVDDINTLSISKLQ